MFEFFIAAAVAAQAVPACTPVLVAGQSGENHVLFRGVSPDGKLLAVGWDRGSGEAIERGAYLLDLASGKRTVLPYLNNAASFSPDGSRLVAAVYASPALKTEIVELDLLSGTARTYASSPATEWLASYSRDGEWILFNSMRSGASDLYRIRRSDSAVERLTQDPAYEAHGQWIAADSQILFHRQVTDDDYDIAALDLASGEARAIGATRLEESYPAMSADGRWIAFSGVGAKGEQPNLFIMRDDGSDKRQLTTGNDKDAYATWSPDGRSLFFVRFHADGARIYRLAMKDGECTKASG